jgi:hypothetical protein
VNACYEPGSEINEDLEIIKADKDKFGNLTAFKDQLKIRACRKTLCPFSIMVSLFKVGETDDTDAIASICTNNFLLHLTTLDSQNRKKVQTISQKLLNLVKSKNCFYDK